MAKRKAPPTAEDFMYQVKVLGHLDFENEWHGWKLRGPYLVSPSGDRVLPERLIGIMFTESMRVRGRKPLVHSVPSRPDPLPVVVAMPGRVRHVA